MNDGQYTNLRNYLEEIAMNTKRILDLLETQQASAAKDKPATKPKAAAKKVAAKDSK